MARLYVYITGMMTVRADVAFPLVIEALRDAGIDVVDYDEGFRRLVFRAAARLAAVLESFLRSYAESYSFEVKASLRASPDASLLRRLGAEVVRYGNRLLLLYPCGGEAVVWGEARGRRLLLKYCRGAGYRDPASYPQGLCGFTGSTVEFVEQARACFERLSARLVERAA